MKTRTIEIGKRTLGQRLPVQIVAEVGTTVNGSVATAKSAIDAAKRAGADFIKFMMIGTDALLSRKDVTYRYETATGFVTENMYEMFKALEFSASEWQEIVDHACAVGMDWFISVDYEDGVDLAESLGTPAYKLGSWDVGNLPLIRRMALTRKPILVDTGPATVIDLQRLLDECADLGNEQVVPVHCTHSTDDAEMNLRSFRSLEMLFRGPVGFSADERDSVSDIAAVALGASMIEKRLTLSRSSPGHHHLKSLEPGEFADYVSMIRRVERLLGADHIVPSVADREMRSLYFVSVVADRDIPTGTTLSEDMLACRRPGNGLSPEFLPLLVGRTTRRPIVRNEQVMWSDV